MNLLLAPRKSLLFWAAVLLGGAPGTLAAPPQPAAAVAQRVVEVRIVARKAEGGARTVRARRGEMIALRFSTDEKMVVHVHGYDVHRAVTPGAVADLTILARHVGRFPVTAHLKDAASGRHGAEPTLLYLEVHPE